MEEMKNGSALAADLRALADAADRADFCPDKYMNLIARVCGGISQTFDIQNCDLKSKLIASILAQTARVTVTPKENADALDVSAMGVVGCVTGFLSEEYRMFRPAASRGGEASVTEQLKYIEHEVKKLRDTAGFEAEKNASLKKETEELERACKASKEAQDTTCRELFDGVCRILDELSAVREDAEAQSNALREEIVALERRRAELFEAQNSEGKDILERAGRIIRALEPASEGDAGLPSMVRLREDILEQKKRCDSLISMAKEHEGILGEYRCMLMSLDELEANFKNLTDTDTQRRIDEYRRTIRSALGEYEKIVASCIKKLSKDYSEVWKKAND